MTKIGVIRETKEPSDARVVITPALCEAVVELGFELVIQRSEVRCIPDSAYEAVGAKLVDDVTDCDILVGVKEVKKSSLIADKTYFFFSHTHKGQEYNRKLLKTLVNKNIRMIDYELLTYPNGARIIAFGKFAGMVGAHNALWSYNKCNPSFEMNRMHKYDDYQQASEAYKNIDFPNVKIVLTGTGRVAGGAVRVLTDMGIQQVEPADFLSKSYSSAVFTQLACKDYVARNDGGEYADKDYFTNPSKFHSIFRPYTEVADIMINGIFWDTKAPAFFTAEEMKKDAFNIKTIADVTCDIAPETSIPSTLFASTIADPIFTYDPKTGKDTSPCSEGINMMTIDNLPNELPVDASGEFGKMFVEKILPEFLKDQSDILDNATLCRDGALTQKYNYLSEFI